MKKIKDKNSKRKKDLARDKNSAKNKDSDHQNKINFVINKQNNRPDDLTVI